MIWLAAEILYRGCAVVAPADFSNGINNHGGGHTTHAGRRMGEVWPLKSNGVFVAAVILASGWPPGRDRG